MVNYFGVISCEKDINWIKRNYPDSFVILDNVQAPFRIEKPTLADVTFTSLRKAYPVPDGGMVLKNGLNLPSYHEVAKFSQYKIAASYLKEKRTCGYYDDDIYLDLFHRGEESIDDNYDTAPSDYTLRVFRNLDIRRIAVLRKRNTSHILSGLIKIGLKPCIDISENDVPLFVPILLSERDKVRKAMFSNHIFLPVHWPVEDQKKKELKRGLYMSQHELSIIIDHRYSISDMDRILKVLADNI